MARPKNKRATVVVHLDVRTDRGSRDKKQYHVARWTDPATGKRCTKAIGWMTPDAAKEWAGQQEGRIRLSIPSTTSSPSTGFRVGELIPRYLGVCLLERVGQGVSERYYRSEKGRFHHVKRLLADKSADTITRQDLLDYAKKRGSERSRNRDEDGERMRVARG